jgi:hypothetical protein
MSEFRYVGIHSDELDGGRPLEPGEFTGPIDADLPQNKRLIDDGLLIAVDDGAYDKVRKQDEKAEAKADKAELQKTNKQKEGQS